MVTISGHSDDCIEIDGDIVEEFSYREGNVLGFNDGTVLSIDYIDPGIWRINRIKTGSSSYEKIEAEGPDVEYSDKVTLKFPDTQNFFWVVYGDLAVRAK